MAQVYFKPRFVCLFPFFMHRQSGLVLWQNLPKSCPWNNWDHKILTKINKNTQRSNTKVPVKHNTNFFTLIFNIYSTAHNSWNRQKNQYVLRQEPQQFSSGLKKSLVTTVLCGHWQLSFFRLGFSEQSLDKTFFTDIQVRETIVQSQSRLWILGTLYFGRRFLSVIKQHSVQNILRE
jgi:hypothetical protein